VKFFGAPGVGGRCLCCVASEDPDAASKSPTTSTPDERTDLRTDLTEAKDRCRIVCALL
jgi:hypothetical protein